MDLEERHERLRRCLEELAEANRSVPVLVEGRRDEAALRRLGLTGEILVYNSGRPLVGVAESIAQQRDRLILLVDWDRTGGALAKRLQAQLHARVDVDLDYRKELARVSQVRCVEDLPAALRLAARRAGAVSLRTGGDEE